MPRTRLERFLHEESGLSFYFGYQRDQPDRLHVDVRGVSVEVAVTTYLEGTLQGWDDEYRRFETRTSTHGIYWTKYHQQEGHILVISCFEIKE